MEEKSPKELQVLLEQLRQEILSSREEYHAIQTLGRMNVFEARPVIEQFLNNSDPALRMVALKVLTRYWQRPEHWETALQFLKNDPDNECRIRGATALGDLQVNTSDPKTLKVLAHVVSDEKVDLLVREAAYAAMRSIIHYDPREQLHLARAFDLTKEVDWEFVKKYL